MTAPFGKLFELHQRQIHLDFHTSPFIGDVACEFKVDEFVGTLREAQVNSVTVFAKCHHGMSYYPTKIGTMHPALGGRDLLGEMTEGLRRAGIRCPVYTTVVWEEDVAAKHPEWRQMRRDGRYAASTVGADNQTVQPGLWKFNNFLHPDYQDYIEAHVKELTSNYATDGVFFDILMFHPEACWSDASVRFRKRHRLMNDDPATQVRFEAKAQAAFARRFADLVRRAAPKATVFFNAPNFLSVDPSVGARARARYQSHLEIESLPSGLWGYHHFPRIARAQGFWGKPWLAQTARFQKMWGDFGGIKPLPALEFECFRTQALGGANLVGDQLPPRGTLDASAYELIGSVYSQVKEAEEFYRGSVPLPQIGIFSAYHPGADPDAACRSEEGAITLADDDHYDSRVLDASDDFKGLAALILPDTVQVSADLARRLKRFWQQGGKLVVSYRSGFDATGVWRLGFLPIAVGAEDEPNYPTYWRARANFDPALHRSDRVVYHAGTRVTIGRSVDVLVDRVLPYFKRSDLKFSSHFQTPPVAKAGPFPAVVAGKGFSYFADPIFREYRASGNTAVRKVWTEVMKKEIGPAPFGFGLPSTVLCVPRRRGNDLCLTLLHYVPVRKALEIDVIDERMGFAGLHLKLGHPVASVREFKTGRVLQPGPTGFALPPAFGRLLLEVPGYFSPRSSP